MFETIGEIAGRIWTYLNVNGDVTLATLRKDLNLKPDQASLSLGWLAREDKLNIQKKGNSVKLSLK